MTRSSGMHGIAFNARAPFGEVFNNRGELVAVELVVAVFLEVQVSEARWRILQRHTMVQVDAFIHTISATIDRQHGHLVERRSSNCAVGVGQMMRDRDHRHVLIEYSRSAPPGIALFDHAEVCVLHDQIHVAERNAFNVETILDGICIVATGVLTSCDSFFFDGDGDAAIFQETRRTIVRKVCSKDVNWFARVSHNHSSVTLVSFFSVQSLCSLCLGGGFCRLSAPHRHREHRDCTEKCSPQLRTSYKSFTVLMCGIFCTLKMAAPALTSTSRINLMNCNESIPRSLLIDISPSIS